MRPSLVTSMGELDVILTCDKLNREASECSKVLEEATVRANSMETWSSSVEVLRRPGLGGPDRGCCMNEVFGEIPVQQG